MNGSFQVHDDTGPSLVETIAPDEGMLAQGVSAEEAKNHYFIVGRSALRCIRVALAAAGKSDIRKILDLPCGHGRVLRALKSAFPEAELHACDLLTAGMEFCRSELGAVTIPSDPDPKKINLKGPYDLIWVGSLFTHFDRTRWLPFLQVLHKALAVNGICIFTTHGEWAVQLMRIGESGYGLSNPKPLLATFERDGFSYANYEKNSEYGVSFSSVSWVSKQIGQLPNARIVSVQERGWAMHQDVYAWQKVDWWR